MSKFVSRSRKIILDAISNEELHLSNVSCHGPSDPEVEASLARIQLGYDELGEIERGEVSSDLVDEVLDEIKAEQSCITSCQVVLEDSSTCNKWLSNGHDICHDHANLHAKGQLFFDAEDSKLHDIPLSLFPMQF